MDVKTKGYMGLLVPICMLLYLSGVCGSIIWKSFQIGVIWRGPFIDPRFCISREDSPTDFTLMIVLTAVLFLIFFTGACWLGWIFVRGLTRSRSTDPDG